MEELSEVDRQTVNRARRLERFLTQPFFTTEHFTGRAGVLVRLEDTLSGCERILNDEFANIPEQALYMIGDLSSVIQQENQGENLEKNQNDSEKDRTEKAAAVNESAGVAR